MNKRIKKAVALIMSFVMIFFALNTVFSTTLNAEELPGQEVMQTATSSDAEKEEATEPSTEVPETETAETTETETAEELETSGETPITEETDTPETDTPDGEVSELVERTGDMLYAATNYQVLTHNNISNSSGASCGYFTITGVLGYAVCGNQNIDGPAVGTYANNSENYTGQVYRDIFYYGYGGPGAGELELNGNKGNAIVALSKTISYYSMGDAGLSGSTNGSGMHSEAKTLYDYAVSDEHNAPSANLTFSKTSGISVSVEENVQKTETITLKGDAKMSYDIPLDTGMCLYKSDGTLVKKGGTATIYGGTKFYITAPLSKNDTWKTGTLYSNEQTIGSVTRLDFGATAQPVWFANPVRASASLSVEFAALGSIKIQKESSNKDITDGNACYSLKGAQFTVENADKSKSWTMTTKADGTAQLDNIPVGSYTIKETKAPKGYALNPTVFNMTVTTTHTSSSPYIVKVSETPKTDPVRAVVQKKSADGDYEGEYLENAQFTVKFYKGVQQKTDPALDGEIADRTWVLKTVLNDKTSEVYARLEEKYKISGDDFYFTSSGRPTLPFGTVTIEETKAPNGYFRDTKVYVRTITDDGGALEEVSTYNMPVINEKPNKRPVQFIKLGESGDGTKNPLANAGFKVCRTEDLKKDASGNYIWDESKTVPFAKDKSTELFTDKTGSATSCPLFYGEYMMRETTVPDDYVEVDDIFFTVDDSSSAPIVLGSLTDKPLYSYLRIYKKDSETGKSIISSKTAFRLWSYADDDYVSFDGISEFETDEEGTLFLPGKISVGKYRLEETQSPDGYYGKGDVDITVTNADGALYEVYVDENGTVTDDILTTVTVYNDQLYGVIQIDKSAENRQWDEKEGFVSKDIKLSGIEFGIYAAEDIYSTDGHGTLLHTKGDKVGTVVTDENGYAESEQLYLGSYTVVEENTPPEYETSEPQTVTIAFDDETVDFTEDGEVKKLIYKNIEVYNAARVPKLKTTAKDTATKSHIGSYNEKAVIEDVVHYDNLIPGRKYKVSGVLMVKSTGKPLLDMNGKEIRSNTSFTAEKASGEVSLFYTFDSRLLARQTVVVFEDLYHDGEKVATHADIEDSEQSVYYPKIGTKAVSENGTRTHIAYGILDITDTCSYENVVPGYWYRMSGILMNRATDKPLRDDNGKLITGQMTFYAKESSGTIDVSYSVDVTYMPDYYIVVFEELYFAETGTKIAVHRDINDDGQTIKIKGRGWLEVHGSQKPSEGGRIIPNTGDGINVKVIAITGMLAFAFGAGMLLFRKRKKEVKRV